MTVFTETATRPPGRSTRRNSERPRTGSGKNISPRLHSTASKLQSADESACPSSTETEAFRALPRRSRAFSAMGGETSAAVTWPVGATEERAAPGHARRDIRGRHRAGGANGGESRLGRKPRARRDIKDMHTRGNMSGPQEEGHEMCGDVRKGAVVL